MDRRCVVVAFGDIYGFGVWARRASNTPEVRTPFIQRFYGQVEKFVLDHDYYVKYLGDGLLILKELPSKGHGCAATRDFLQDVAKFNRQMRQVVRECDWPSPDGFRTRIVTGHVDKVFITDPIDKKRKIPEYVGYAVNLAQRLLEIQPSTSLICHESVLQILGSKKKQFSFKKILKVSEKPRGVDPEDVSGLWIPRILKR